MRRLRLNRVRQNQRGDTIVEVLVAMAIMSLVLVGAFVTSNRNRTILQNSQEREQGQRLAEGQIEMLRAKGGITTSGNCFDNASETSACGNFSATNSGATYTLVVIKPGNAWPAGASCDTPSTTAYSICAYWTSLGAKTDNDSNVTLYYRLT